MSDVLVVMTNTPNIDVARKIADDLLEKKIAACVNIVSGCESHFIWKGKREQAAEFHVQIKTTVSRYNQVESSIRALHPYHVPEIIAFPVSRGSHDYLSWVTEETWKL
ncbi:MAG TPA: divalent-cation tolerance protein CutA [Burkholderiales bacterium]|nr:divalent-cation tolerance protein CutA [Burkholderiales bacterium]